MAALLLFSPHSQRCSFFVLKAKIAPLTLEAGTREKSWSKCFLSQQLVCKERVETFLSTALTMAFAGVVNSTCRTEKRRWGAQVENLKEDYAESGKETTEDVEICTFLLTLL